MSPSIKIIYKLQFSELGGAACGHCHLHPGHHAPHPGGAHRQLRGHNKYCTIFAMISIYNTVTAGDQDPAGPRRHAARAA